MQKLCLTVRYLIIKISRYLVDNFSSKKVYMYFMCNLSNTLSTINRNFPADVVFLKTVEIL